MWGVRGGVRHLGRAMIPHTFLGTELVIRVAQEKKNDGILWYKSFYPSTVGKSILYIIDMSMNTRIPKNLIKGKSKTS